MTDFFLDSHVRKSLNHICERVASPVSLKVALLLRYGEWDQLVSCKVDPSHYLDSESYWADAQCVSLLRKVRELPTSYDREAAAEENFLLSERACKLTNDRLYPYQRGSLLGDQAVKGVHEFVARVRKIIAGILGPVPKVINPRFGPGSTFGDRGGNITIPDKMSSNPTMTPSAWTVLSDLSTTLWSKAMRADGRSPVCVPGNRFTTVPKDAEKDRGICIEPSINVYYQLGLGGAIRSRLLTAGIDLRVAHEVHKRVACEASVEGHMATIDLSNASDTVSRGLVKLLLPDTWYRELEALRSPKTLFRGRWVALEKFSSMGNGFTFELETLIFLGLCLGVTSGRPGHDVFVFGDDIIVPTHAAKGVIAALKFFGFTPNDRKTFVSGPFRESCGGDYFLGVDVRPHFLKELPFEPQHFISLANGLRRTSSSGVDRFAVVERAWFSVLDALPSSIRSLRGPSDLGDLLIHDEETRWRPRWRSSIRYFKVYRPSKYRKIPTGRFSDDVALASSIYGVKWSSPASSLTGSRWRPGYLIPRDSVLGYKIGWVPRS